ncbi:hypothetical protein DMENIID0001_006590 [Sergentomyia squamirostris]
MQENFTGFPTISRCSVQSDLTDAITRSSTLTPGSIMTAQLRVKPPHRVVLTKSSNSFKHEIALAEERAEKKVIYVSPTSLHCHPVPALGYSSRGKKLSFRVHHE